MVRFIDQHRATYGVDRSAPCCRLRRRLTFCGRQQQDPTKRSARAGRDDALRAAMQRVWDEHEHVDGPRKVWRQLRREGMRVARCTVERLMRDMGLRGTGRGRAWTTTTQADPAATQPADLVDRRFVATRPNPLWVAVFTFVVACRGHEDDRPIHYPRATANGQPGPPSPDGESFKWFVANERDGARYALPDLATDRGLPTLPERAGGRGGGGNPRGQGQGPRRDHGRGGGRRG